MFTSVSKLLWDNIEFIFDFHQSLVKKIARRSTKMTSEVGWVYRTWKVLESSQIVDGVNCFKYLENVIDDNARGLWLRNQEPCRIEKSCISKYDITSSMSECLTIIYQTNCNKVLSEGSCMRGSILNFVQIDSVCLKWRISFLQSNWPGSSTPTWMWIHAVSLSV